MFSMKFVFQCIYLVERKLSKHEIILMYLRKVRFTCAGDKGTFLGNYQSLKVAKLTYNCVSNWDSRFYAGRTVPLPVSVIS